MAPLELTVESVAYGGSGVGRLDGKVVFIPFTVPGEKVSATPVKVQKRFCEARLDRVIVPSPLRREARCPLFGECGGCAYQHVPYQVQLEWKRSQVEELFRRIAKIAEPPIQNTVPSPLEWEYRNRIRVHARDGRVGFFRRDSSKLVDVKRCAIASESVNSSLEELRSRRPKDGEYTVAQRPYVRFFEQTNDEAAEVLARVVENLLPNDSSGALVDAYCGAGFFARRLAVRFSETVGIESHPGAVAAARAMAGPREKYVCGDVALVLGEVLSANSESKVCVLLDPPAEGLAPRVIEVLGSLPVTRLVYVSCDPATQARDVASLMKAGYRLEQIVPVDMFPQTSDVEVVAVLEREG